MNSCKTNIMIMMINERKPRTEVEKHFTKEEIKIYDEMNAQLKELRKDDPKVNFSPIESEW